MGLIKVTIDGRVVCAERRHGRGPTLVLLHGAGGNHQSFDELLPLLRGQDLLVPALPGRAESEGPPLESMAEAAKLVRDLCEALDIVEAVPVGHSMGGGLAIELAMSPWPSLVGLVLLATGARLRVHPLILEAARRLADGEPVPYLTGGLWQAGTTPELVARVDERMKSTPPRSALADWNMANAFDRMDELDRVEVPALVLVGTRDLLTPVKYARYLAAHLVGAQLHELDGAGHLFPIEQAARTVGLIQAFLEG